MNNRPKTIFLDVDGVILEHTNISKRSNIPPELLSGVLDKFEEWDRKGYKIILTTGRKESERGRINKQLQDAGIVYDELIMGIGGGERIIINDYKENSDELTARAICVKRNEGLVNVFI